MINWCAKVKSKTGRTLFCAYAKVFHGISFRMATGKDLDALYQFRFRMYCDTGYLRPEDHPDQRFTDKYDAVSAHVIALRAGAIIGAARVTPYSAQGLPVLEYFNVVPPVITDHYTLAELGRFMVDPAFQGSARLVSLGLSAEVKRYLGRHPAIEWLVAFMPEPVRQAFAFYVPFHLLREYPVDDRHLQARNLLPGYWAQDDIHPVMARASELLAA